MKKLFTFSLLLLLCSCGEEKTSCPVDAVDVDAYEVSSVDIPSDVSAIDVPADATDISKDVSSSSLQD